MIVTVDVPEGYMIQFVKKTPEMRKCDVCDRTVKTSESKCAPWLTGFSGVMCRNCFIIWYDGETDPAKIRERSLTGKVFE